METVFESFDASKFALARHDSTLSNGSTSTALSLKRHLNRTTSRKSTIDALNEEEGAFTWDSSALDEIQLD